VIARRWQQLQAELDALDAELQVLIGQVAPALLSLPGVGVDTAGQLLVTVGDNPIRLRSEAAFAHPVRGGADPGLLGPDRPSPPEPWRRPARQQRAVAYRAGPDALPRPDQGICPAADHTGLVQARHPALPEALCRPRGLRPPHPGGS